jgi:hypothetical protein
VKKRFKLEAVGLEKSGWEANFQEPTMASSSSRESKEVSGAQVMNDR